MIANGALSTVRLVVASIPDARLFESGTTNQRDLLWFALPVPEATLRKAGHLHLKLHPRCIRIQQGRECHCADAPFSNRLLQQIPSMPSSELIRFDCENALIESAGITEVKLHEVIQRLDSVRHEMLNQDLVAFHGKQTVPDSKIPLDAGFMDLPDRLLAEYDSDRSDSLLGRILDTAKRIRETVDRVVVLGIGGSYMGARALMDACCEPYYNELSRADRGSRPRMYFEGNNVDNDSISGLIHLLEQTNQTDPFDGRWAIVVISKSGGTIETAVALRQMLRHLEQTVGTDQLSELVVPVTGAHGKLTDLADAIGCRERFEVPEGVGGRFSVMSAVGLLPAAILGLDVVSLLNGAWLMNGHFQSSSATDNLVLNYVGINHLWERDGGANLRVLSVWNKSLETVGLWYDQLLAESIGKQQRGVTPLTVVNTRDLHSRAQQHQEGARDKIINNLIVDQWRCDPLAIGYSDRDQDELNALAETTYPELMSAACQGTNEAYRSDNRPTTSMTIPKADEHSLGQLFQMLMLATVAEGGLLGVNPYGQPGVEMYKANMNRILREQETCEKN